MREFKAGERVLVLASDERSFAGTVEEVAGVVARVDGKWVSTSGLVLLAERSAAQLRLVR